MWLVDQDKVVIESSAGRIVVQITGIIGNKVHVGVEAPRRIPIYRAELHPTVKPKES